MSSDWQQTLGLFDRSYTISAVNGKDQKFYSLSGRMLCEMKPVISSVSKGVLSMINTVGKDFIGQETDEHLQEGQLIRIKTSINEASPSLIQKQYDLQGQALEDGLEGILGKTMQDLIPLMIMDSMREVFLRDEKSGRPIKHPTSHDFYESTPAEIIVEMIVGMWRANEKLLNPFQEALEGVMDGVREKSLASLGISIPGSSSNAESSGSLEKEVTEL